MCYLKVHLSAHASWPVYYSTHADLESSRGGNVRKFSCLFLTLITIKCRSTWINSILRIFGRYFKLVIKSLKQIKCEKDLKSEYISDSIISQFIWISSELRKDRIRNIFTFRLFSYLNCFKELNIMLKCILNMSIFLLNFAWTEGKRMSLHATVKNTSFRLVVVFATMQAKIAIHYGT